MSQRNQQPQKHRVVILTKDDMLGVLSLGSDGQETRVTSTDPRRPMPSVRVHEHRDAAVAEFNQALADTLERGWVIAYDGPPLFG